MKKPPKQIIIKDGATKINDKKYAQKHITDAIVANSVTYIGAYAFAWNDLESIDSPKSVAYIGKAAFYDNAITAIAIGEGVEYDSYAFGRHWISFIESRDRYGKTGGVYTYDQTLDRRKYPRAQS
jgi:hypothetical protein